MIVLKKTNSEDKDFIALVINLDRELAERDGDDHAFYAQFNKIDKIKYTIVAYNNNMPVGIGAIKEYQTEIMEVKRMFVLPAFRGSGIASQILQKLELWAKELNYKKCILETGIKQPEAIRLYSKNNYSRIPNYGQYKNIDNSVCFEKQLRN
jgi:putative acetyltransferase